MKVFVQAENESIVINNEIIVTVLSVSEDEVVLEIHAPDWVDACTKETLEQPDTMLVRPR